MSDVILHHYPQSPVAEKVRVVLGIKNLEWHSVEIPRLPPKPDLTPLTGGYRRTPVLQVGADVYCDSQCIIRELERRFPTPTLYPGGSDGMVWGVSRWTDGPLFTDAIALVLGHQASALPPAFAEDRGALYFGPSFDLKALEADVSHTLAQLRSQLGWINDRLAGGRAFMLGEAPGLPDALAYHLIWFIRGRYDRGPAFLSEFPSLEAWEARVRAIGHGRVREREASDALAIAKGATPEASVQVDPMDPQGFSAGDRVTVVPLGDSPDPKVRGTLVGLSRDEVAIAYQHERTGPVVIHFPRTGYRVAAA